MATDRAQSLNNRVCKVIKKYRMENHISQGDMASVMGVSRPTYSLIENCQRRLTLEEGIAGLRFVGAEVSALLGLPEQVDPEVDNIRRDKETLKELIVYLSTMKNTPPDWGRICIENTIFLICKEFSILHQLAFEVHAFGMRPAIETVIYELENTRPRQIHVAEPNNDRELGQSYIVSLRWPNLVYLSRAVDLEKLGEFVDGIKKKGVYGIIEACKSSSEWYESMTGDTIHIKNEKEMVKSD